MKEKSDMKNPNDSRYEEFLHCFRNNEDRIFGFILMCVPNFSRAEDLLQDTMLVMWRKFSEYQNGTSFAAWGIRIAQYNIYNYHREHQKEGIVFSSEVMDKLCDQAAFFDQPESNTYVEALLECFEKLEGTGRRLISLRYRDNLRVEEIAKQIGQTVRSTYRALSKVQHLLGLCIQRTLRNWGSL